MKVTSEFYTKTFIKFRLYFGFYMEAPHPSPAVEGFMQYAVKAQNEKTLRLIIFLRGIPEISGPGTVDERRGGHVKTSFISIT